MKATGIVRRIDDLGRVVIPKEIRRNLRIREGDPLEIFVDREGEVILKKYSPIGELGDFAREYAESLHETTGHITLITDRDAVVAVAGASKKQWLDQHISPFVERAIEGRRSAIMSPPAVGDEEDSLWAFAALTLAPIVAGGDSIGSVILATEDEQVSMGELELKLVETAAGFLARQMEQ